MPEKLNLLGKIPLIHWLGDCVNLRCSYDVVAKGKISSTAGSQTLVIQSVACHCTDRCVACTLW